MTNQDNHSIELEPIDCKHKKGINGSGNCKSCGEFLKATPYQPMDIPPPPEVTGQLATDEQQDTKPVEIAPAQPEQHTTELPTIERLAKDITNGRIAKFYQEHGTDLAPTTKAHILEASTKQLEALINHKVVSELEKSLDEHARTCGARRVGDPRDWCRFQEVVEAQIEALKEQGRLS